MEKYYRILEISRTAATEDDVKRAYRKKALLVHPDRNPQGGEAFKALQDAYEAALADVKRGSNQCRNGGGWSRAHDEGVGSSMGASSPSPPFTANTAAGAAFSYARATTSARQPRPAQPPPLFSEEELFGDAVPGGWRNVGAHQRAFHPESRPSRYAGASPNTTESRWRRAHGSRVPLSAYESAGPVPPPPRSDAAAGASYQPAPSQRPHKPSSPSSPSAGPQQQQQQQNFPQQASSTQAQWEAFLAQEHPWRSTSSPQDAAQNSSEEEESAEDRAVREALYLHRRAQEQHRRERQQNRTAAGETPHPPPPPPPPTQSTHFPRPMSSSTSTATAGASSEHTTPQSPRDPTGQRKKEELYRQWQDVQNSLHRKLNGEDSQGHSNNNSSSSTNQHHHHHPGDRRGYAEARGTERAGDGTFPTTPGGSSHFAFGASPRRINAHHDSLIRERRALQREYLRFRYTPDPADVGSMSDMEVYLLTELLGDIHGKMQAVLQARLAKGLCSTCGALPRTSTCLYFTCAHKSICAVCHAAGVLSCPLCGARRSGKEDTDDSDDD